MPGDLSLSLTTRPDLVCMGFLGKAHGIKGEISMKWLGETPPAAGMPVLLEKGSEEPRACEILSVRLHKDRYLIFLKNVENRTMAEQLSGSAIFVEKSSLPPLDENEVFLDELIGYDVFLENGNYAGKLDHVEFPANQQIWVISKPGEEDFLFPAREASILEIDGNEKKIIINPPSGLWELYRA